MNFRAASSAATTSGTLVAAQPTATAVNDVMIAAIGVRPSTATITAPAGWTLVRRMNNASASSNALAVYRKAAGATEPASYSWTLSGSTHAVGGIQSFSGVDTASPINVENGRTTTSSLTHPTPSISTTVANSVLVTAHTFSSAANWTSPTGMTEGFDVTTPAPPNTAGQSIVGSWVRQAAPGATGIKTATASNNADVGNTHILALRPAANSLSIALPAGAVADDVMIASIGVTPATATLTPPAGWTLVRRINNASATANSLAVYLKVLTAQDPVSYAWIVSGASFAVGGIQAFINVDTVNPLDVENGRTTPSALGHPTPSVTTTVANAMVVTSHTFASSRTWTPPAGMTESFDQSSGVASSTGQSIGSYRVLQVAAGATGVKTANAAGNADVGNTHILALRPATPESGSTPFTGTPLPVPGTFEAENFDLGGEGVAYHDNTAGNAGGQFRTTEDVDIIPSTDTPVGGYVVNDFESGEWLAYTINVAQSGNYRIEIRASTTFSNSAFHIEIDGANATGSIGVPNTASFTVFQNVGKAGIALSQGQHSLRLVADQQFFDVNWIRITQETDSRAIVGEWRLLSTPLESWSTATHLLPTGMVMSYGSGGTGDEPRLWNPATETESDTSLPGYNLFCAGHAFLADGRLLVVGGHTANYVGMPNASTYDAVTNVWAPGPAMNGARWYPTATTLANGDVLVVSGSIDSVDNINLLPEVFQNASGTWRALTAAQLDMELYPWMHLAPNGKVFLSGPRQTTRYLDTAGTGTWTSVADHPSSLRRTYGSSVMYDDGKVLVVGGGDPPTNTAEVIDLNAATPSWQPTGAMAYPRRQHNATLLPDGKVLVTGGSSAAGFNNYAGSVYAAEIWDPATGQWTTLSSAQVPRQYHSEALLLPDGRVLSTGDDRSKQVEVYSPPYLFKGARPTIASAPAALSYGQSFFVGTPDTASIAKVQWIRLPSVTHSFNQNQVINRLSYSQTPGGLTVVAPSDPNLAPPGHYMLFVLNGDGVPSVARIVRIGPGELPDTSPPTVTASSPANAAVEVAPGTNVTATFSEAMSASSITTSTMTLVIQGTTDVILASVSYDAASRTATLDPNADLGNSTTYVATIKGGASGVTDTAGNPLAADATWTFTTTVPPPPDTTAPTVTVSSPANAAVAVAPGTNVTATFSEAMSASSITSSTITLVVQGTTDVLPATVTYDAAAFTATLDPTADLTPSTTYVATVKSGASGVTDAAGNPLAADATWTFTTTVPPPPDTTPPTVTASSPANAAVEVAPGTNVTATFDEAMSASSITSSTMTLVVQGTTDVLPASVSYEAASRTATLDPTADLTPSTTYVATIKSGASGVTDTAGNPLAADTTWTFTTAAAPAPAPSTFPVVQSVTVSTFVTDVTSHQVAMPAAVSAGDLLVALFSSDGTASVTAPNGWTQIGTAASGTTIRLSVHLRVASGSESGTTFDFATATAEKAAAHVYRISGWHGGTISGAEGAGYSLAMTTGAASTTPNPPLLNPGTWDVENVLWLAVEGVDNISGAVTPPAGYTDALVSNTPTDTGRVSLASARRSSAVAAEDPAVFTNVNTQAWVTATLAIRPE